MSSTIAKLAIYVLEGIFAIGILGSALVVILTSIEDFEVFFSKERIPSMNDEPGHLVRAQAEE